MLVLPVLTGTRMTDKGEKIRRFLIGTLQCPNQLPGFRLYTYREPRACLPTTVGQDIPLQVAPAQIGNVYKRNSPQHKQQQEKLSRLFQSGMFRQRFLQTT